METLTLDNKVENKFSAVNNWKLSSSSELKLSAAAAAASAESDWADKTLFCSGRFRLVLSKVKHLLLLESVFLFAFKELPLRKKQTYI